ncbi:MAG: hypothetical protein INF12_09860 [Methylobacterium sp.]|nr:hypothetical protein [Methylobacterium sp.]
MMINVADLVGFMAAGCTVLAFASPTMVPLRCAAIAANVLLISYGLMLNLTPILALHGLLLPLNLVRLYGALRQRAQKKAAAAQLAPAVPAAPVEDMHPPLDSVSPLILSARKTNSR